MQLKNNTPFQADFGTGFAKDGRRLLFIAIKATYQLSPNRAELIVHSEQQPLVQADISTGEPGYSAVLYETDFSTFKPACDILLNGCAYVPDGKYDTQVDVALQVDSYINKSFRVKGHRTWGHISPEAFNAMPFSFDNAFGGTDNSRPQHLKTYQENPIGTGYSYHNKNINEIPLPNTEEFGHSVSNPKGKYKPMSFGAIGRSWPLRSCYAGTYNQHWVENTMPFYPDDFDYRYFQCAPVEQQMPYVKGGEEVTLVNLSRYGDLSFKLPEQVIPVTVLPVKGQLLQYQSVVDTVIIEPELDRVMMVSRAVIPLHNNVFEIDEIVVGQLSRQWFHQQRTPTKHYYQTISEFIASQQGKEK